jgi:hypothetical protein
MSSKYEWLRARGRLAAIPAVAAAAVAAGGLGVSAASAQKVAHAAAGTVSAKQLAAAKAYVANAQKAPAWTAPGPAVNAKKALKGKTIVTFPVSSEIDACNLKGQQGYLDQEAQALGAKVIALTTPSGPPSWISNLGTAITDKPNAVVMLCAPPASALTNDLATLKADKIPVIAGNYNETGGSPAFPLTGLSAETGISTAQGVETELADALVNLKGKPAHVLFVTSSSIAQGGGASLALKAAFKKFCPGTCSLVKQEVFPTQDWSGPTEDSAVASDLQANSSINAVLVAFDAESDGIVSDVQSAAKTHPGLKLYAWGGGIAEIQTVDKNPIFAGDSGPDEKWDAYTQLDQVIRLLSGKPAAPVAKETVPNIFFTKSNAATFYSGDNYSDKAYSNGAFINDFLKLWGVK